LLLQHNEYRSGTDPKLIVDWSVDENSCKDLLTVNLREYCDTKLLKEVVGAVPLK